MTIVHDPIKSRIGIGGHPLHPILVHVPVALLVCVLGADLGYWLTKDPFWQRAGLWLAGIGALGGWVAALVGTADWMCTPRIRRLVTASCHAVMAVMMLSVSSLSWILRWQPLSANELAVPAALSALGAGLLVVVGIMGGQLVYEQAVGVVTHE